MQEIRVGRHPVLTVDPLVVHRYPTLGHGPFGGALAGTQPGGHQQVDDSIGPARRELGDGGLAERGGQRRLIQTRQFPAPEKCRGGILDRGRRRLPMHERGQLPGQPALRGPLVRPGGGGLLQLGEFRGGQECEPPQVADDVKYLSCLK